MATLRFLQLDVFADRLGDGNPLAVVLDADALDSVRMQRIARWTNQSETSFLLRPSQPGADYRVRIFTTREELPFAGHPSIGAAYAAIHTGMVSARAGQLIQECAAGLLPLRIDDHGPRQRIHVQTPPARVSPLDQDAQATLRACLQLGAPALAAHRVDNGPHWAILELADAGSVRELKPDMAALGLLCERLDLLGACVYGSERGPGPAIAVRAFCPSDGMPEDPATGSANAAIAATLQIRGEARRYGLHYSASQGREIGCNGLVEVRLAADTGAISVGGACVIGLTGELHGW